MQVAPPFEKLFLKRRSLPPGLKIVAKSSGKSDIVLFFTWGPRFLQVTAVSANVVQCLKFF